MIDRHEELAVKLGEISVVLDDIKHRLFGNGQPGELSTLDGRVGKLEEDKWRLMGVGALIMGILQFFTGSGVVSLDKLIKVLQAMH